MGRARAPGVEGFKPGIGGTLDRSRYGQAKGGGDPRPTEGSVPAAPPAPTAPPTVRQVTFWRLMQQSLRTELTRRIVTRIRGAPIPDLEHFDWREFQIGGQTCFRAVAPDGRVQGLRSRMLRELTTTGLSRVLARDLMLTTRSREVPAEGGGTREVSVEHAAYIYQSGHLGRVVYGERYRIDHHEPATRVRLIGYCHTHPPSPQIRPPTIRDDFLDSATYPVQFMIEASPARIWALMSPNFACILGGLGDQGTFFELQPSAPQAGFVWALSQR